MRITFFGPQGPKDIQSAELVTALASETGTIWVDMTGPTDEDVRVMSEVFHFHPLAIEDTRNHMQRPKVEEYKEYLFTILNPVSIDQDGLVFRELDAFVGHNYLVTVHLGDEPVMDETRSRIDHASAVLPMSASYLAYLLMDTVVDGYFPVLDIIGQEIEGLEDSVLADPRRESLNRLFRLKRMLVDMWRVVWPQREIFNRLTHHHLPFIDQEALQYYLRDVSDHLLWITDMVNTFRDTITGIMDLYMSAVSNRLNQVVNRLTVFALVIGVLTVIGGFYGMNFAQTWPPFADPWGVPFVVGMMVVITGVLLALFRWMGWY